MVRLQVSEELNSAFHDGRGAHELPGFTRKEKYVPAKVCAVAQLLRYDLR